MDFFLVPNDPLRASILSANGRAHYTIHTSEEWNTPKTTVIYRENGEDEDEVAEIRWGTWPTKPTMIRSYLFGGIGSIEGVPASHFLYKHGFYSKSRYFIGDDEEEYQWRIDRSTGFILSHSRTREEVALYSSIPVEDGIFAGEKRFLLRVQPCSIDLDLVILTFVVMEVKRRFHTGDEAGARTQPEDPVGDGGVEGGE